MAADGVMIGDDGVARCGWAGSSSLYCHYHDAEWGIPVADDVRLFEKLSLEGFQSGLSWLTILRKRENFRTTFAGFDIARVAAFDGDDVTRLLADAGIVRHRGKIEAVINNAGRALELIAAEGSLAAFVWGFEPVGESASAEVRSESDASRALARELRRRGWRFVGPTTVHSFLQAMGLINEHVEGCFARPVAEAARAVFVRPGRD